MITLQIKSVYIRLKDQNTDQGRNVVISSTKSNRRVQIFIVLTPSDIKKEKYCAHWRSARRYSHGRTHLSRSVRGRAARNSKGRIGGVGVRGRGERKRGEGRAERK